MSQVTLKDVASHAGVSHQTVSNVLNNHPSIRPLTRERVLHSVQALDYQLNQAAKALREARVTTLCCAFAGHDANDVTDPYRNLIQSAFIAEARAHGYSMTTAFVDLNDPTSLLELQQQHQQRLFDGVVLVSSHVPEPALDQLIRRGIKLVLFDLDSPRPGVLSVNADYAGGMAALVRHHAERGRRHLALILPTQDAGSSARARLQGFLRAAAELGVQTTVIQGDWSAASGEKAMSELWQRPERPDAVLGGNDRMAAGALLAAYRLGIKVPEDLAISGFDDFEFAQYTQPALTTVQVPHAEMARQAVRQLLGKDSLQQGAARSGAGETDVQTQEVQMKLFPTTLIARSST